MTSSSPWIRGEEERVGFTEWNQNELIHRTKSEQQPSCQFRILDFF